MVWVTLTEYKSKDFGIFKMNIIVQYPEAAKGARYTICNLEHIILNTGESDVSTEMELVQHYRQFHPIVMWLVANSKISEHERDRYLWQGHPHSARLVIGQWLQHTEANYTCNETANFEKVVKAGWFVLSNDVFDTDLNESIASHIKLIRDAYTQIVQPTQ